MDTISLILAAICILIFILVWKYESSTSTKASAPTTVFMIIAGAFMFVAVTRVIGLRSLLILVVSLVIFVGAGMAVANMKQKIHPTTPPSAEPDSTYEDQRGGASD